LVCLVNGPGGVARATNESGSERYLDAFYFVVTTMFLVGFGTSLTSFPSASQPLVYHHQYLLGWIGDIAPKYSSEVAYTILVVIIGFTLCAGIVANLVPLYAHHAFVRQKYENQV
jgi:hypothetical protein